MAEELLPYVLGDRRERTVLMPYPHETCEAHVTNWWDRLWRQPFHYCGRRRVRLYTASGFPTFYCDEHYPKGEDMSNETADRQPELKDLRRAQGSVAAHHELARRSYREPAAVKETDWVLGQGSEFGSLGPTADQQIAALRARVAELEAVANAAKQFVNHEPDSGRKMPGHRVAMYRAVAKLREADHA